MVEFMKLEKVEPSYMDTILTQQQRDFINKQDTVIKEAFIRNGVDVTDIEFIKANVSRIIKEGDEFEHYFLYYGTPDEKRIISIQINPTIVNNSTDNKYTITTTSKYY